MLVVLVSKLGHDWQVPRNGYKLPFFTLGLQDGMPSCGLGGLGRVTDARYACDVGKGIEAVKGTVLDSAFETRGFVSGSVMSRLRCDSRLGQ